jgi:hypothetical protein
LTCDTNGIIDIIHYIEGGDNMAVMSIRMPDELASWLRQKAAKETIKQDKQMSINSLVVKILTRAMKADKKKGG